MQITHNKLTTNESFSNTLKVLLISLFYFKVGSIENSYKKENKNHLYSTQGSVNNFCLFLSNLPQWDYTHTHMHAHTPDMNTQKHTFCILFFLSTCRIFSHPWTLFICIFSFCILLYNVDITLICFLVPLLWNIFYCFHFLFDNDVTIFVYKSLFL